MKKMMMCVVFVFVFAFAFNTVAYEQFGEGHKSLASSLAKDLLSYNPQYKEAAACAAICKDIEQAELARKQKKLVEVQIELAAEQKKFMKAQTELAIEQKKLVKAQTELLDYPVKGLLKSLRSLVDETEKRVRNGWMR